MIEKSFDCNESSYLFLMGKFLKKEGKYDESKSYFESSFNEGNVDKRSTLEMVRYAKVQADKE